MTTQPLPPWLTVTDAAALVGKSVSTIRRILPQVEREEPEAIRREPIEGKGGERVLLLRSWLLSHFGINEPGAAAGGPPEPTGAAAVVEILERQLDAKDKQIAALQREAEAKSRQIEEAQRTAGELVEKLGQFAALNATLQQKLLLLSERAGEPPQGGAAPAPISAGPGATIAEPWLWVAVAVLLSLCGGLVLWLVFG
jgi:hypothetical protein